MKRVGLYIWLVRIMASLVLGGGFYRIVFSESLGELFLWIAATAGTFTVYVLWLARLEQIQKIQRRDAELHSHTHPRPLDD